MSHLYNKHLVKIVEKLQITPSTSTYLLCYKEERAQNTSALVNALTVFWIENPKIVLNITVNLQSLHVTY